MARKGRYSLFGRSWFNSRWWTRVVPAGTRGAKKGYVSKMDNGVFKGLTEIWTRPRRRPVSGAVWHLKRTRGGRGRWG